MWISPDGLPCLGKCVCRSPCSPSIVRTAAAATVVLLGALVDEPSFRARLHARPLVLEDLHKSGWATFWPRG